MGVRENAHLLREQYRLKYLHFASTETKST